VAQGEDPEFKLHHWEKKQKGFEASLDYIGRLSQKIKKNEKELYSEDVYK
jgi:hypothetical protein